MNPGAVLFPVMYDMWVAMLKSLECGCLSIIGLQRELTEVILDDDDNKPLTFHILCIQKVPLVEKAIMMIILMMIMNLYNAQGGQQNVPVFVEEHPLVF